MVSNLKYCLTQMLELSFMGIVLAFGLVGIAGLFALIRIAIFGNSSHWQKMALQYDREADDNKKLALQYYIEANDYKEKAERYEKLWRDSQKLPRPNPTQRYLPPPYRRWQH